MQAERSNTLFITFSNKSVSCFREIGFANFLSLALNLSPQLGSMLGGTLVTLRGPCIEESDVIECIFDGISTPGVYVNRESVMCVSPAMNAIGKIDVTLQVTRGSNILSRSAFFYSGNNYFHNCKNLDCCFSSSSNTKSPWS